MRQVFHARPHAADRRQSEVSTVGLNIAPGWLRDRRRGPLLLESREAHSLAVAACQHASAASSVRVDRRPSA